MIDSDITSNNVPLVVTPELLNYLHNRFLHDQVPWIAEAVLLLSEVCRRVGYEQYVMDAAVRAYLIGEMRNEPEGQQRMEDACSSPTSNISRTNSVVSHQDLQRQQWAALVCLDEHRVAGDIAESFQRMLAAVGVKD